MKAIKITIEGITPLMLCAFTDAAAKAATDGTRSSASGERMTPKEQAESYLYKDESGRLVIPSPNMLCCIMDGGTFFKSGKSKITTQKSSLIPACVMIEEVTIPIVSKDGWTIDTRPVRIPATGGRILCHRPVFNDWRLTFAVQLDPSIIGEKLLREIIDAAGTRKGIGAYRPACKGVFGRFKVIRWEAKELDLGLAA
jgi:hypothetical protein